MSQDKQQWGTRIGVILAVSGSAVGLGNFLRFPAQDRVLENAVAGAESRKPFDDGVGPDLAIRANFYVVLDDRCGMDRHF